MYSTTEPIARRRSTASSVVSVPTPLRHPTPDLQSLQGAYLKNIDKLERTAERMSRQNSIQSERNGEISVVRPSANVLERMGSTRSTRSGSYGRSIKDVNGTARWGGYSPNGYVTSPVGSLSGWSSTSLSRVGSGSKGSRWAQIESVQEDWPLQSPQQSSFSMHEEYRQQQQQDHQESREVSASSFAQRYDEIAGEIENSLEHVPPPPPKHNAKPYVHRALQPLDVPTGTGAITPPDRPRSTDTYREAQIAFQDFDGVHFSPDTEEYVEVDEYGNEVRRVSARSVSSRLSFDAASMLRTPRAKPPRGAPLPDDGMVYYPAPVPKMLNLPKRLSKLPAAEVQAKRRTQMLNEIPDAVAGAPWLNQKKVDVDDAESIRRTSEQHSRESSGQNIRESSGQHSRESSGALPKAYFNERMSANIANLPPQLRAEMFFEHQPVAHDVEVKSESAVATLDSILAASASAPVHAFTDHPFAGDVRKSVYAMEKTPKANRQSTATIGINASPEQKKPRKRRTSSIGSIGALLKRTPSNDELAKTLNRRGSRTSILPDLHLNVRKRRSELSVGDDLDGERERSTTPADEMDDPHFRGGLVSAAQNAALHDSDHRASRVPTVMSSGYHLDEQEQIEEDFREVEQQEDVEAEEGEPLFVQPSTLLAELQVRKAQQKSRNKTAATAFPNGMHSTLLELDAVDEINKRKRQNQRIQLAWEDPHQRALEADLDKGDEDVPLGMLFATKGGVNTRRKGDAKDWDLPIGLIEKRQMEDNEPLSRRRNRLVGRRAPSPERKGTMNGVQVNGEVPAETEGEAEAEDEDEGETLAQRMKRMRMKEELDGTIAHVELKDGERPVSSFSEEILGQFGVEEDKDKPQVKPSSSPQLGEEEETLGQRRARLQREREAAGLQRNISDGAIPGAGPSARPPMLRSSTSLANLLAANPVGQRAASKTHQPAQGSLLHANAQVEAKHKNALMNTNMQSSFQALEKPLVDPRPQNSGQPKSYGMLAQQHNSRAHAGGFASGTYNNGMGGLQLQQSAAAAPTTSMNAMNAMNGMPAANNGYYASPTAAMAYGGFGNGSMSYGYPQQQMYQQPMVYQQSSMMNPMAYNALSGGQAGMASGYNPYIPQSANNGATYASYAQSMAGLMGEEGLDPTQRAAIDRWRLGIGPQ